MASSAGRSNEFAARQAASEFVRKVVDRYREMGEGPQSITGGMTEGVSDFRMGSKLLRCRTGAPVTWDDVCHAVGAAFAHQLKGGIVFYAERGFTASALLAAERLASSGEGIEFTFKGPGDLDKGSEQPSLPL